MSGPSGNQLVLFSLESWYFPRRSRGKNKDSWENKTNCFLRDLTLISSRHFFCSRNVETVWTTFSTLLNTSTTAVNLSDWSTWFSIRFTGYELIRYLKSQWTFRKCQPDPAWKQSSFVFLSEEEKRRFCLNHVKSLKSPQIELLDKPILFFLVKLVLSSANIRLL